MYELARPLFPVACEAFEDYSVNAVRVSGPELPLLKKLIDKAHWDQLLEDFRNDDGICTRYNLSKRELEEFKKRWL